MIDKNIIEKKKYNMSGDILHDAINILFALSFKYNDDNEIQYLLDLLVCYRDVLNKHIMWHNLSKICKNIKLIDNNIQSFPIFLASFVYILSTNKSLKYNITCDSNSIITNIKLVHNLKALLFHYCDQNNIKYQVTDNGFFLEKLTNI